MEGGISPVLKTTDFTEKEKGVIANFNKVGVFSCFHNGRQEDQLSSICHARIKNGETYETKNMINAYKGDHPHAKEFLDFLTSFDGPFGDLMKINPKGWTYLMVEGKVRGFCIPDDVMAFKPWALMFAFLICSRMPTEAVNQVSTWAYLVKRGVNKTLALIACQYLSVDTGALTVSNRGWTGGHQAFVDSPDKSNTIYLYDDGKVKYNYKGLEASNRFLDTEMLLEGKYHKDLGEIGLYCSHLWRLREPSSKCKPLSAFAWSGFSEKIKTSFTEVNAIRDDKIVEAMADFQKFLKTRYKKDESTRSR